MSVQDTVRRESGSPHPLCVMLRELRRASKLSLAQFEIKHGIPAVVVGAYERGDRVPPLAKLDTILDCYGYQLAAIPTRPDAVRRPTDIVAELRAIADQLESVDPPAAEYDDALAVEDSADAASARD